MDMPPNPPEKPGYRLDFHDEFEASALDTGKWVPFYLPQWSSRARAAARYELGGSVVTLRIDPDQPEWTPEFEPGLRVSSLQTGLLAGPVGSASGQHRSQPQLRVREAQPMLRSYVPQYGFFELRARAELGPGHLAALWTIGFEERPEDSGEITIMEIFGDHVSAAGTRVGHGIKPVNDPRLVREFHDEPQPVHPAEWHIYAAEWRPDGVDFYLDDRLLHSSRQSPAYPMQFMLNVYELPGAPRGPLPRFCIDYFRAYRPLREYAAKG